MSSPSPPTPVRARYRIRFGKDGALRYISHLDLARVWERTLRRAGAPLMYSQGFNPHPQMQLAAALPLGCASTCELLDIWLEGDIPPPEALLPRLQAAAPEGLTVQAVWPVDEHSPALQTLTRSAVYHVRFNVPPNREDLQARVKALLEQPAIWRERRGKHYDLRPLIERLEVLPEEPPALELEVKLSQEEGTGRPDEVLDALGLDVYSVHITRTAITFATLSEGQV